MAGEVNLTVTKGKRIITLLKAVVASGGSNRLDGVRVLIHGGQIRLLCGNHYMVVTLTWPSSGQVDGERLLRVAELEAIETAIVCTPSAQAGQCPLTAQTWPGLFKMPESPRFTARLDKRIFTNCSANLPKCEQCKKYIELYMGSTEVLNVRPMHTRHLALQQGRNPDLDTYSLIFDTVFLRPIVQASTVPVKVFLGAEKEPSRFTFEMDGVQGQAVVCARTNDMTAANAPKWTPAAEPVPQPVPCARGAADKPTSLVERYFQEQQMAVAAYTSYEVPEADEVVLEFGPPITADGQVYPESWAIDCGGQRVPLFLRGWHAEPAQKSLNQDLGLVTENSSFEGPTVFRLEKFRLPTEADNFLKMALSHGWKEVDDTGIVYIERGGQGTKKFQTAHRRLVLRKPWFAVCPDCSRKLQNRYNLRMPAVLAGVSRFDAFCQQCSKKVVDSTTLIIWDREKIVELELALGTPLEVAA